MATSADSSRTILIIDDAQMFRDLCALFLARCGRVISADNGTDGLALARAERPDVVLVDLHMPGLDGAEVCRAIREDADLEHTSLIALVGENQPQDRARALRAGADAVVTKPISRVLLLDEVNRYLRNPVMRGQPRISVAIPIRLRHGEHDITGTARNLSRGGVYVETERSLAPDSEIGLQFILPETELFLHPTAQVIWRRVHADTGAPIGLGLRFLEIDGEAERNLDDYIYERVTIAPPATQGVQL